MASSLGDMKLPVLKAALPPPPPMQQRGISAAVPQQQQQQAAVSAAPKPYQQYRPLPPPPQPQPVVALPPPPVVRHRSGVPHPSEYGIPRPRVPSGMYTPSVRSEAQWHNPALDRVQVSESHANYGAFYNDPSLDPTGGAQQRYSREPSAQARCAPAGCCFCGFCTGVLASCEVADVFAVQASSQSDALVLRCGVWRSLAAPVALSLAS